MLVSEEFFFFFADTQLTILNMSDSAQSAYWLSSDPDNDESPPANSKPQSQKEQDDNNKNENNCNSKSSSSPTKSNKTSGKKRSQQEVDLTESNVKKSLILFPFNLMINNVFHVHDEWVRMIWTGLENFFKKSK